MNRARLNFTIFSLAVIGAGWLGVAVDSASGEGGANQVAFSNGSGTTGMLVFIVGPVVVALLLYFLSRDGGGGLGLRPSGNLRTWAAAAAFYPAVAIIALTLGVASGTVTVSLTPAFYAAFAAVFAVQLIKNPIEEFVFRGYGTRTAVAMRLPGNLTPHILVGVVWAAWHLPLYLVWTSAADMKSVSSLPLPLFLLLMFAGLIAAGILYGELRVRTGSIWPGVLMHCMSNAIATPLMLDGFVTFEGHADVLFAPVASAVIPLLLTGAAGLVLVRNRPARQAVTAGQSS